MLPKWLTALLALLHEGWSARPDAHIRLLKLPAEMVKERLPGRAVLAPVERRRLMKIGAGLDHRVEDTLKIVSIRTYRRWQRDERTGREPGKVRRSTPAAWRATEPLLPTGSIDRKLRHLSPSQSRDACRKAFE